jgi:hypothetical protein
MPKEARNDYVVVNISKFFIFIYSKQRQFLLLFSCLSLRSLTRQKPSPGPPLVFPSVRFYQCNFPWTDFHNIRYCKIVLKSGEKVQIW